MRDNLLNKAEEKGLESGKGRSSDVSLAERRQKMDGNEKQSKPDVIISRTQHHYYCQNLRIKWLGHMERMLGWRIGTL